MTSKSRSLALFLLLLNMSHSSPLAQDVVVLDGMFTNGELDNLREFLSHEETLWRYKLDLRQDASSRGWSHPWSAALDVRLFDNSTVLKKFRSSFDPSGTLSPYKIEGQIIVRGDHVTSSNCTRPGYSATLLLVENWSPNSYGEMVVYDLYGEVSRSIAPRYGRLILLPCLFSHVIKPPSIDVSQRFHALSIFLHEPGVATGQIKSDSQAIFVKERERSHHVLTNSLPSCPPLTHGSGVEGFVTSRFTTPDGRKIVVLDGIIPKSLLDALASVVSNGAYTDFPAEEESSDNVQWILSFETEDFLQSSLWPIIHDFVGHISGSDTFFPYDIGCNNIQGRDSPTIHTDCPLSDDDYTVLIYLNANWSEHLHGETIFFSDTSGSEFVYAVRPRYGRVAIFHGAIPHSGRPPPFSYQGEPVVTGLNRNQKQSALQFYLPEAILN